MTHAIDYHLVSLSKYEITDRHEIEIKDNDIENMLSYGVIDDESIDEFVLGNIKTPFLIKRNTTNLIADTLLRAGGHVVVYGALGNGKSFLLRQLKTLLCSNGLSVYVLDDIDADYVSDIDYLSSLNSKNIIFIDGYDKYLPVIEYISRTNQKNIRLVISARVAEHEYGRKKLSLYNLKYKEFNIDILDESEIEQFIDIVNNLGVWGENAGLSFQDKKSKLKTEHDAQISIILLLLLESPQIKQRLNDLMKDIISPQRASTIFSICLCNILGIPIERSVISELACSDDIYSPYYTTDDKFRQVIKATSEGGFAPGSSLFSVFIVKHYFSATAVTKYLLQIADKYERLRFNGEIDKHIFKSMLKFSFIERVMPSNTKLGNMQSYYESLKTHIKWLTNDSHFWLQYAMCYIAFDDFNKAQQKLDEAYGIASRKTDYHTFNIDTQQAKVYLLSSKKISDSHIAFSNFEKAHSLLNGVPNDIYKIRQLLNYEAFYRDNYSKLSKQNKIQFHRYCKKTLDDLNNILSGHGDGISFTLLHKTIRLFEHLSNTTDAPVAALSDDEIDR
ncbi:hypothetical protein [Aeromonas caviae]|uniref:P-loop NTPase n=1 Tax=Aeromonas caviae TaxID=648 RepID=UPI000FEBDF9A|nr:hypothetical protein [Aeromonas caviae]